MHALSAHRRSTVGIAQGGVLQVRLRVASGSVSSGWMGPRLPICTILWLTYYGKEDSGRCVGYIFSRLIGGVMARSSSAVPF